jgi:ferrous iron transport protein B
VNESATTGKRIALVGNPNVGKSVLFRNLTGKYATVSNYPGTTVAITTGELRNGSSEQFLVIDTPGTNNLIPSSDDERITKKIILEGKPAVVIQVGDMKNLRRTLHLTYQLLTLLDSSIPLILTLNMEDEAKKRRIQIEVKKLEKLLKIPVVATTATMNLGTDKLLAEIKRVSNGYENKGTIKRHFLPEIEEALEKIEDILKKEAFQNTWGLAEMVLQGDTELLAFLQSDSMHNFTRDVTRIIQSTQMNYVSPLPLVMTKIVDNEISKIVKSCSIIDSTPQRRTVGEIIDDVCLNPYSGLLIFLATIFLVFYFVGIIGAGEFVDYIESVVFVEFLNPHFTQFIDTWIPIPIVHSLLVGEYGVITFGLTYAIAIVFPVVTTFFIAFSILEDSGYLPRLAFLGDKLFRKIGLNGKAVLPLVLGTGCTTMATMTTRILETRKERLIATMALALGIPCSAQLAVILGILTYISPIGSVIVFAIVISQLLLVTYLLHRVLPGEKSDFIMELPPLRIPQLKNVLIKTWGRVEWFLKEAIPLFVLGTLFISFLSLFSLVEIIQYFGTFGLVLILWRQTVDSKKTEIPMFAKKHTYLLGTLVLLPSSFFLLYWTGLPQTFNLILRSLLPDTGIVLTENLLNVVLVLSKPVVVLLLGLPPEAAVMYILGFLRRDYGAAGFFDMASLGTINANQIVVATVVLTLFVPCVANFFVIAKENGSKTAVLMVAFIIPFAILIGTLMNFVLTFGGFSL